MLTQMINGVAVELTDEEEKATLAEWEQNASAKPAPEPATLEDVVKRLNAFESVLTTKRVLSKDEIDSAVVK